MINTNLLLPHWLLFELTLKLAAAWLYMFCLIPRERDLIVRKHILQQINHLFI